MSSRALRKLHGGQDLMLHGQDDEGRDSDDDELINNISNTKKSKKKKKTQTGTNPFLLLGEDDENGTVSDDKEEDNYEELPPQHKTEEQQSSSKKKKKKKKKKKQKEDTNAENKMVPDDIEASIEEVNRILQEAGGGNSGIQTSRSAVGMETRALLFVEHKNLNPDNEMRRIFGSRVVQAEMSNRRQRNTRVRPRISWLATPKDTWPPYTGRSGLSMKLLESKNGVQHFVFEHSHQYQQTQFLFYDAVESLNPQNIADILRTHSYHIDALIQLSEVFRMNEDMPTSADLIERSLYAFEMAFHTLFSLTTGNCRLDFRRTENRAFYLALFKHLVYIGQKGCNRTALEFCKLLLSLDPDGDPMCVLLMIDFYALRCEEYSFLIRLFHEWQDHRNLTQLPNFAFSVPLAMFLQASSQETSDADTSVADKMIQDALIMFPGMLMPLLDKCGLNPDSAVSSHEFFGPKSEYNQSAALKQLIGLYIGRCHSPWKQPEVVLWLEENVKKVLQRVDQNDPYVEECSKNRAVRYQGTPRNILRHIMISEIKDATAALPPDVANTTVLSYDPLPPTDSISSYQRPERQRRLHEGNTLSLFLRSLLPNFNANEPAAEEQGAEGGGQGTNLQQGVNVLMEAMRDLLNNIRPVDPPVENQHNGDQGDGEDDGEWD